MTSAARGIRARLPAEPGYPQRTEGRPRSWTTWLAVSLSVLTWATFAMVPVLDRLVHTPEAEDDGAFGLLWVAAWVGFPLVGGFLAARRPRHPVGWILIAITLSLSMAITSESIAIRHVTEDPVPLGGLATWVSLFSAAPAFILIPFLVLLFPTGRIASRAWRRITGAAIVVALVEVAMLALRPSVTPMGVRLDNPIGIEAWGDAIDVIVPILGLTLGVFGVAVVGHAVVRFRRAVGVERQQFRWFALSAATFPIGMGASIGLSAFIPETAQDALVAVTFFVSFNGMAAAIGIAITRYRLYEIDRVVSRTVSYVLLTGALLGTYALGVLGVGALLPGEPSDVLVAGSTLMVAALFRPLRSRIQGAVDRRFNRARYDAVHTLEAFTSHLREEVDVDSLVRDLHATARATFGPRAVAVWTRAGAGS